MSTANPAASAPVLPAAPSRARERLRAVPVKRPELWLLLLLAAVLDLWALDRNGYANTYYAGAVRSMTAGWHDFLYASFDPAGVMTVDKPPLALWVQAASAKVFGFSSWSLLVPQALMGVATVALAYDLTRRRFGRAAGFAAGLVLATTPITVAVSRHNNPDALVVLCSTAALWALLRALETGRTRWLAWCGVAIGLGFETKMGAALLVVPALAAAYLWVAPRGRVAALRQLGLGGLAMAVVGLAWPVLVWLTPAASRPWVSGTKDNSIWSLILNYNGVGRLDGQAGGPGGAGAPGGGAGMPGRGTFGGAMPFGAPGGGGFRGPGGGGGNALFGGSTGPLRLVDAALGGQAGWLLGCAVVGGLALIAVTRLGRSDPRTGWAIAAGGAWVTIAVAFSAAQGIFHPYYVSMLAPFTAVLVGATVGLALQGGRTARIVAPLAIAGGVASELLVIDRGASDLRWAVPVIIGGGIAAAVMLAAPFGRRVRAAVVAAALGLLLLAPAGWAVQTLGHATSGTFPAGGPSSQGGGGPFGGRGPMGGGGPFGGDSSQIAQAVAYAKAHGGGTVAVSGQQAASQALIDRTGSVAALGGFSGRESQVSASWLAQAVRDGRVRFVLADGDGMGMPNDSRVGSRSIMSTVQSTCATTSVTGLYDCRGRADAIAKAGA